MNEWVPGSILKLKNSVAIAFCKIGREMEVKNPFWGPGVAELPQLNHPILAVYRRGEDEDVITIQDGAAPLPAPVWLLRKLPYEEHYTLWEGLILADGDPGQEYDLLIH